MKAKNHVLAIFLIFVQDFFVKNNLLGTPIYIPTTIGLN